MKQSKIKFKEFEYWPYWLFYTPMVPYWILKSVQSGSFSYFCKVNPGLEFGGALDYSKAAALDQVPEQYKPNSILIENKNQAHQLLEFPFVAKPNFGERGVNVELIQSEEDWEKYPLQTNLVIQEFIDLPLEFGLFYARHPQLTQGEILSITGKEFLVFTSDGKTTLKEFVLTNPRSISRKDYLAEKFKDQWEIVLPKGNEILLEPIGNHNRGTRFYDASDLITNELNKIVDAISKNIKGFYYGRFDVKAKSVEALKKGEFIIMEVNGSSSEPTHIYDGKFSLFQAYKEVIRHLDYQYEIAKVNPRTYRSIEFYQAILRRLF